MVLLAAAVCSKNGQAIVSRQFVEMTRARIEGLLSAFSKLLTTDKQHTFVETESVRYVYQPMEKLYMLLITTKASNILEDLETLRLFSRVIPEYCRTFEEREICENSFQIIAAFDEIVALGYRENVNLNQIRTFTEMDSQEEKVYLAVRQTQEREAREVMKRKSKELQRSRQEMARSGRSGSGYSGFGGGGIGSSSGISSRLTPLEPAAPSYTPAKPPPSSGRAMKLGAKTKGVDSFVDQIRAEGGEVKAVTAPRQTTAAAKLAASSIHKAGVHVRMEEKITVTAGRDSGLESLEVRGIAQLHITNSDIARCRLLVHNGDDRNLQFQTHPNVDKKLFGSDSVIALKQAGKSFPINSDVPVLKWRFVSTDESQMPLSINCWPSENDGRCDVNIEYELVQGHMELQEVTISIPCPSGVGAPTVDNADGQYNFDSRRSVMAWQLPVIDSNNKSGSMEFTMPGRADDFFPVQVNFVSTRTYCDLAIDSVTLVDDQRPVDFSQEKVLAIEKYEIM